MCKELKESFALYHKAGEPESPVLPIDQEPQLKECGPELIETYTCHTTVITEQQFRFNQVKELYSQGYAIEAIARALHIQWVTIRKYISMETLPNRESRRTTNFASFHPFLLHESNVGRAYKELYEVVKKQGFGGEYSQFCGNMNALFKEHKIIPISQKICPTPIKTWSSRRLSIMIQQDIKDLNKEDAEFLTLLYEKNPIIKETKEFISRFKKLFQNKEEGTLKTWLADVSKSTSGIKKFAKGLESDFEAVNNAVVTPYSNGQLEGQVNRLKNINRRMYGRAGFELLRRRVIFKSG